MFTQTMSTKLGRAITMTAVALAAVLVPMSTALAHCDTMDGPVVTAARKALENGKVNGVLMWVTAKDEREVRDAFQHTLSVRKLGPEARDLADRYFFETVVRLHRQSEGEPYTGLKPAGTDQGKAIPAADRALASGNVTELEQLLTTSVRTGLHERFERALSARKAAPDDVQAGRAYVAAYVALMHYVETAHAIGSESHGEAPAPKHTP